MQPPTALSSSHATPSRGVPVIELAVVTLARVVINTAHRMIYPFLPAIGRGLGVTPSAMRLLVGARSATGFTSPLFGPLSDRFGRRAVMLLGLGLLTLCLILVPLSPVLGVSLAALVLVVLSKVIYDPATQAYVSDRVPYDQRGRALGVVELSWSAGLLVGAPLVGLSIQRWGWTSPFVWLAGLAVLAWLAVLVCVRRDSGSPAGSGGGLARSWGLLRKQPAALGALGFAVLICSANEIVFVVYGEWMEGSFGLQVGALGLLTAIIGVAELGGELAVVTGSDRLGKRRVVLMGLVVSAVGYVALPWLGVRLPLALAVLFVMFLGFEVLIVASIPLVSELVPSARGTMMSAYLMALSAGRTLGALLAGPLWNLGGLALNGLVAAMANGLAFLLVVAVVVEAPPRAKEAPETAG